MTLDGMGILSLRAASSDICNIGFLSIWKYPSLPRQQLAHLLTELTTHTFGSSVATHPWLLRCCSVCIRSCHTLRCASWLAASRAAASCSHFSRSARLGNGAVGGVVVSGLT